MEKLNAPEELTLLDVPPEVLLRLLSHYGLSARQLAVCEATCQLFKQAVDVMVGELPMALPLTTLAALEACLRDSLFNRLSEDNRQRLRQRCGGSWKLTLHYLEMLNAAENRKWGQVIACRDFSLVVSPSGVLHSFGCGADYRLGTGYSHNVWRPVQVGSFRGLQVRQVSAGPRHTVLCTNGGNVYTFGMDQRGCCGHGDEVFGQLFGDSVNTPRLVERLVKFKVVQVAAGFDFTAVLSSEGDVLTFGSNRKGCLGQGIVHDESIPRRAQALEDKQVIQIAAGINHMLASTKDGYLYTWGEGKNGKLGHGTWDDQPRPQRVERLRELRCHVIAISGGVDISVALTACGEVYTWGWGCSGRLGHGGYGDAMVPQRVKGLDKARIVQVGAASKRTFAISDTGHMYTFGWAAKRALELSSYRIVQAAMGTGHTLVLTDLGEVLAYGSGERGQLGFKPDTESMHAILPTHVPIPISRGPEDEDEDESCMEPAESDRAGEAEVQCSSSASRPPPVSLRGWGGHPGHRSYWNPRF